MDTKVQEIIRIIVFYKDYQANKLNPKFYNIIIALGGMKYAEGRLSSQIVNNLKINANMNITTQTISKLTGGDKIILFSEYMLKTKKLADARKHQLLLQAVEYINFSLSKHMTCLL